MNVPQSTESSPASLRPAAGTPVRARGVHRFRAIVPALVPALVPAIVAGIASTLVGAASAQEPATSSTPPEAAETAPSDAPAEEARHTGLPSGLTWKFNFDAGVGYFGFGHSLYTNPRPDPSGDLSSNWAESFIKPAISMSYKLDESELYGKLSAVGERTFSAPPVDVVGEEASSFAIEDLHLGWRSGTSLGESENLLELTAGRAQYRIGHGSLLWDGGGEGGSRGGYWSNARKAWELAGIVRVKPGRSTFEAFYLDRDEVPESDTDSRIWGGNYELTLGEATTLGATYLDVSADPLKRPLRDGMSVLHGRGYSAPFNSIPDLSFEVEYALEENGDRMRSEAWNGQVAYRFSNLPWTPRLSYRYAFFEGDDPATPRSENFDSLFPGFYDWGTWWQGEIAGGYFLSNSNLITDQVRLHLVPSESLGMGLITFLFQLDQPEAFAPQVTSRDVMVEFDLYLDWKIHANFLASVIAAYGNPHKAVEQAFDRTHNFTYGLIYVAYSY